jgi:hypothetical protein
MVDSLEKETSATLYKQFQSCHATTFEHHQYKILPL